MGLTFFVNFWVQNRSLAFQLAMSEEVPLFIVLEVKSGRFSCIEVLPLPKNPFWLRIKMAKSHQFTRNKEI